MPDTDGQVTTIVPGFEPTLGKCAMCPHKDTWVSCICAYELRDPERAGAVNSAPASTIGAVHVDAELPIGGVPRS